MGETPSRVRIPLSPPATRERSAPPRGARLSGGHGRTSAPMTAPHPRTFGRSPRHPAVDSAPVSASPLSGAVWLLLPAISNMRDFFRRLTGDRPAKRTPAPGVRQSLWSAEHEGNRDRSSREQGSGRCATAIRLVDRRDDACSERRRLERLTEELALPGPAGRDAASEQLIQRQSVRLAALQDRGLQVGRKEDGIALSARIVPSRNRLVRAPCRWTDSTRDGIVQRETTARMDQLL